MCGLAVTLTFDLMTSKSNQFTFAPNCVNFVKFLQVVCRICYNKLSACDHRCMHYSPKTERLQRQIASGEY